MPTYEYECTKCGHHFDVFQPITSKPLRRLATPCGGCGEKTTIRRLISGGGAVLFKGSGFYETDYRSDGYKKAAKAETEGSSEKKSTDKSGESSVKESKPTTTGGDGKSGDSKSSKTTE